MAALIVAFSAGCGATSGGRYSHSALPADNYGVAESNYAGTGSFGGDLPHTPSEPHTADEASAEYFIDEILDGERGRDASAEYERRADPTRSAPTSSAAPAPPRGELYAQAHQTASNTSEQDSAGQAQPRQVATDATTRSLLIYTATLHLAVHQVERQLDRVQELAEAANGFLHSRSTSRIVIRVPTDAFESTYRAILELGNVLNRTVQVQDVTEEFRDTQTRIRTLEAMRVRIEQLLNQAPNVEAALAIEQHLERITLQLERLRGRLRYLADRVAFSTITVDFQQRSNATEPAVALPFQWLRTLGLDSLLTF